MANSQVIGPDGCMSFKATSAITTPYVFLKFDTSNARQVVVATDEEDAPAGILMEAVAAGGAARVFCQIGGICPVAQSAAVTAAHTPLKPTTGGYAAPTSTDDDCAWAMAMETAGAQYDIISCRYTGGQSVPDTSMWSTGT